MLERFAVARASARPARGRGRCRASRPSRRTPRRSRTRAGWPPNILITARETGSSGGGPGGSVPSTGGDGTAQNRSSSAFRSATTRPRSAGEVVQLLEPKVEDVLGAVDAPVRARGGAQLEHDPPHLVDDLRVDPVVVVLLHHRALAGRGEQELELAAHGLGEAGEPLAGLRREPLALRARAPRARPRGRARGWVTASWSAVISGLGSSIHDGALTLM